jgi:hypothetical protein
MKKIERMSDNMYFILSTNQPTDVREWEFLRANGIAHRVTSGGGLDIFFCPDQREARYAHSEFLGEAGVPSVPRLLYAISPTKQAR